MIAFNENEIRPCATCGSTTCGHILHDARCRNSSELNAIRAQLNPILAPTAPATTAAEPQ